VDDGEKFTTQLPPHLGVRGCLRFEIVRNQLPVVVAVAGAGCVALGCTNVCALAVLRLPRFRCETDKRFRRFETAF
jgi:hypothetical protein